MESGHLPVGDLGLGWPDSHMGSCSTLTGTWSSPLPWLHDPGNPVPPRGPCAGHPEGRLPGVQTDVLPAVVPGGRLHTLRPRVRVGTSSPRGPGRCRASVGLALQQTHAERTHCFYSERMGTWARGGRYRSSRLLAGNSPEKQPRPRHSATAPRQIPREHAELPGPVGGCSSQHTQVSGFLRRMKISEI